MRRSRPTGLPTSAATSAPFARPVPTRWPASAPTAAGSSSGVRSGGADGGHTRLGVVSVKFIVLVYNDGKLLDGLPAGEADGMMRDCLSHADELQTEGKLIESQMLEDVGTAKSIRRRNGRLTITDGPFAETKEVLGG